MNNSERIYEHRQKQIGTGLRTITSKQQEETFWEAGDAAQGNCGVGLMAAQP